MRKVVGLFERAVALDSTFVTAWAYLSAVHVINYISYLDRNVEQLRLAKAALDRVTRLDPECNSGGCCALGVYQLFVLRDYDGALKTFIRGRRVRPNDHDLSDLMAQVYMHQGKWSEALAHMQEALRLNPLDAGEIGGVGRVYAVLRQFAPANYYLDRALAATPRLNNARLVKAMAYLNLTGDLEGARRFSPTSRRTSRPPASRTSSSRCTTSSCC